MRITNIVLTLALAAGLSGCGPSKAEQDEAQRDFNSVTKGVLDGLQWQLDDKTAARIFDNVKASGVSRYMTFRKCHEEPPTHEKNKRICEDLQRGVADAEAKTLAKRLQEKAQW